MPTTRSKSPFTNHRGVRSEPVRLAALVSTTVARRRLIAFLRRLKLESSTDLGAVTMIINGVECSFHHLGIPTLDKKPGERYSQVFDMYTSDSSCESMRVQWHRFGPASSLHPIIRSRPHVAFKVDDLELTVAGMRVLLGPFDPIENYRVALVEDHGQPIEFIQTTLTDDEIWSRAATRELRAGR
jgi:hypothetical protein